MTSESEIRRLRQLIQFTEAEEAYVHEMLGHYRAHLAELLGQDEPPLPLPPQPEARP